MSEEKVYEFKVQMTCDGCSGAVKRILNRLGDKITNVDIDLPEMKVFVTSSALNSDELFEALKKTGKDVVYIGTK